MINYKTSCILKKHASTNIRKAKNKVGNLLPTLACLVGDGARLNSNGNGLISADGTRGYRFPEEKSKPPAQYNPTGTQANFETYEIQTTIRPDGTEKTKGIKTGNGHLVITD